MSKSKKRKQLAPSSESLKKQKTVAKAWKPVTTRWKVSLSWDEGERALSSKATKEKIQFSLEDTAVLEILHRELHFLPLHLVQFICRYVCLCREPINDGSEELHRWISRRFTQEFHVPLKLLLKLDDAIATLQIKFLTNPYPDVEMNVDIEIESEVMCARINFPDYPTREDWAGSHLNKVIYGCRKVESSDWAPEHIIWGLENWRKEQETQRDITHTMFGSYLFEWSLGGYLFDLGSESLMQINSPQDWSYEYFSSFITQKCLMCNPAAMENMKKENVQVKTFRELVFLLQK